MPSEQPDREANMAFLTVDMLENWGLLSPAGKKAAAEAVNAGRGHDVMLVVMQLSIAAIIERWLQNDAKDWLKDHPKP